MSKMNLILFLANLVCLFVNVAKGTTRQASGNHTSFFPFPPPYVYWSPNLISLTSLPSLEFISPFYLQCYISFFFNCILIMFYLHYMSFFSCLVSQSLTYPSHRTQNDFLKCNRVHITCLKSVVELGLHGPS